MIGHPLLCTLFFYSPFFFFFLMIRPPPTSPLFPYTTLFRSVLGIPFDFTAKPVVAPPQPPRETVQVKAVRPERDALEIRFPRVAGYRVELPEERLTAKFTDEDRKSTRLNSSHGYISYAVFCL